MSDSLENKTKSDISLPRIFFEPCYALRETSKKLNREEPKPNIAQKSIMLTGATMLELVKLSPYIGLAQLLYNQGSH